MTNEVKINDNTFLCDDYFVLAIKGDKLNAISSAATDEKVMMMLAPFMENLMLKLTIPTKN